ncbi:MAG: hypothetical protein HZB76_04890 [Chlamydiae bacterium]|nr:hypothetical protein [Chlamydiota bacterium]
MIDLMSKNESEVFHLDRLFFQKEAGRNYQNTLKQFKKVLQNFALFNLCLLTILSVELLLFAILFALLVKSSLLALSLGSIFLSCFTYFVLFFYFQAKKSDQLTLIKDRFITSCRQAMSVPIGAAEHHLSVATAALRLTKEVKNLEGHYYSLPKNLLVFAPLVNKLSCFLHKEDGFKFKEMLLYSSISEHLEQIRHTPTDLEVHGSLANAYSTLSTLYFQAKQSNLLSAAYKEILEEKFTKCLNCTIEEYKILNDYAPNDPWVHMQLASSYRSLKMFEEEKIEHELLIKLCPEDQNILFRLGILYFWLGQNAKGLQVYEVLVKRQFKQADDLLAHYGALQTQELFEDSI